MIYVTSAEWKRLEESLGASNLRTCMRHEHEGKVCMGGERMIRKGYLTKKSEDFSALVFEHIHFEVVDRVHKVKVRRVS